MEKKLSPVLALALMRWPAACGGQTNPPGHRPPEACVRSAAGRSISRNGVPAAARGAMGRALEIAP